MKQRSMRRILSSALALLLMVALLAACVGGGAGDPAATADPSGGGGGGGVAQVAPTETPFPTAAAVARQTYTVQRGTVQDTLEFTGRWRPRDQLQLSFPINGTIRSVAVRSGDTIATGQLLADLQEITDLENQLAQAQLDLETARASLESGESGSVESVTDAEIRLANARLDLESAKQNSPWTSVSSARANLDAAERALEEAERNYNEALSRPQDANSAQSVDSAYDSLERAREQVRSAEIQYWDAAQNFANYEYTIAQRENAVIEAELALERTRTGVGADVDAVNRVRSAELNIIEIQNQIIEASLYSPLDGVVLEVTIQPGTQVQAFEVVITVGLPEPLEVIASLAFGDASRLSVGSVGICEIFNQPDTRVQCAVRRIPLSAREVDQTTRVAATLPTAESGAQIRVEMPLETRENVLWLPPVAINTFQNRRFVVLQTPDGQRSVDVVVGLETDDRVEIVSGVNEGDVVIAGP